MTTTERSKGLCVICKPKEPKAIYRYLNGDKNAPLCGACNMRLWRESSSNEQSKRFKLMATLIGGVETALTYNLEEHEREFLVSTQDSFKRLLRYWAGDEGATLKEDVYSADRAEALKPAHDDEFAPIQSPTPTQATNDDGATWLLPGKRVESKAFGSVIVVNIAGDVVTVRGDDGIEHQIKSYALQEVVASKANNSGRKPGRPRKQTSELIKANVENEAVVQ